MLTCPECNHVYQGWRRFVNRSLDRGFSKKYLDQCSSSVCPNCNHKVYFGELEFDTFEKHESFWQRLKKMWQR